MKALFFVLAACLAPATTLACNIPFSVTDGAIKRVLEQHHGLELSKTKNNELCSKLPQGHASLFMVGGSAVVRGKAVAWATVGVRDQSLGIASFSHSASGSNIDDKASQKVADDLLYKLLSQLVSMLPVDAAISTLDARRNEARSAFSGARP